MKKSGIIMLILFVCLVLGGAFYVIQTGDSYEQIEVVTVTTQSETTDANKEIETESTTTETTAEESKARIETETESNPIYLTMDANETEPFKEEPIEIAFAGDVYLSDHVLSAYDRAGGHIEGVLDSEYQSQIAQADIFMVNQEFPFSDRGTAAKDKQFTFRLPTEKVSIMQELKVDIVTLANNHALDFGVEALLDTCEVLEEAGIRYVGAGSNLSEAKQPVIMETKGKKIAFLGATRVIPEYSWAAQKEKAGMLETYNPEVLLQEIQSVRKLCDYVIVYVHWGIERETIPEEYQRTMGKQYIDAGADLVIGSHPHVLQGMEYYKGKPIVYSLGNFIFGSQIPKTALLLATLEDGEIALQLVPGTSKAGYTQVLTGEEEKQAFFQEMQRLSFGVQIDEEGRVSANVSEN